MCAHPLHSDRLPPHADGGSFWTPESHADHDQHHSVAAYHPQAEAATPTTASSPVSRIPQTFSLHWYVRPLPVRCWLGLQLAAQALMLAIMAAEWEGLEDEEVTLKLCCRHVEKKFLMP